MIGRVNILDDQALFVLTLETALHYVRLAIQGPSRRTGATNIEDHIAPTTFMKMPWLLKLMSVRSSEKFVKLYPSPAFTCLPKWR